MSLVTFEGAKVLVTGASSGIGAALAPMLAARGATVAIVARRADRLEEVLEQCRLASPSDTPDHRAWATDLSDPVVAAALAEEVWETFGHLDVLVNNAARPMRRPVQRLDPETVAAVMTTNFHSPVAMSLALLPLMLERDAGTIVNVSSLGGRLGIAGEAAYSASKFALCGWSEAMAMDLSKTGVDIRLILPGAIATEIWDQADNDPSPYTGPFEDPKDVAEGICAAITGSAFETYVPDMKAIVEFKTSDIETFMATTVEFSQGGEA